MPINSDALKIIDSRTLSSDQSVVDFTSIPDVYKHLWVVAFFRGTRGSIDGECFMRFNNDTGNNYEYGRGQGYNGTFYNSIVSTSDLISLSNMPGAGANSAYYGVMDILIPNYATTGAYRQVMANCGDPNPSGAVAAWRCGTWKNTANPIASIQFTAELGNVATGTVITLYGMAGA